MEIVIIASLITALIAGMAALFAPCCIGVLLPTYFASIFRQRKTVFLMTIVFFFGLLAVFLPLGIGVGFLGELFKEYHNTIYIIGGLFLLILGISILTGFHFSLPFHIQSNNKVTGTTSIFVMGVFSGFATLCCAPVLAGALALSILPGSILWGGIYSIMYVLGMTFPLFIISYFADKAKITEKMNLFKKDISYKIFKKTFRLTIADLMSSVIFILMSIVILYSVATNRVATHSSGQVGINIMASQVTDAVVSLIERNSITFLAAVFIIILIIIFLSYLLRKKSKKKR